MTESPPGCILFATMEFHPTVPGGEGILIHHHARLLLEQGYTVVLLFDSGPTEFEQLVNVDRMKVPYGHRMLIYRLDDLCEDLDGLPEPCPDIAVAKSIRLDHALRKLTQIHEVDLIELYDYCGHGFHYLSQPAADRPPVAIRLHSTIELMERKARAPLLPERVWLYAMERAQLALADAVLAPGREYYEQDVRPLYPNIAADRVLISPPVHMPIGEVEYDPEARRVAFYGRLSTLKGLDTFLRAGVLALEDPGFSGWLEQFVIIGPEEHVATSLSSTEMRALVPQDRLGRFHFTGRLKHAELIPELRNVAFACFANRVEAFCYAAHELHTAGIPLIVNRIPAFDDGFEEGVSATFFDGTAFDLAERMKALARDGDLRLLLSRHGKERVPSYWTNHYPDHLERLRHLRPAVGEPEPPAMQGSAIVLSNGDRDAVERTLASLASSPLRPCVLELDAGGELALAGSRWRDAAPEDGARPLGLRMVGEACLFVRAGDLIEPEWAREALRLLAHDARIGAVGGWVKKHIGIEPMTCVYVPELAGLDEPGLRVLLRVGARQTLGEYLYGWSSQSERSYLLAHRAAGRVSVELPRLAVDIRDAVELPRASGAATAAEFDKFSREFLMLAQLSGAGTAAQGERFPFPDTNSEVHLTAATRSLVVLRKASGSTGEIWVLRLLSQDHFWEGDWSSVMLTGDWSKVAGPDAPVGVQMTRTGSMRFHTRGRTGIEMLLGPFCGSCEIAYRGWVHTIDLKHDEVQTHVVWLDAIDDDEQLQSAGEKKSTRTAPPPAVALKPEHAALNAANLAMIAVAPPADMGIAPVLAARPGCRVLTPAELGLVAESPRQSIAYALRAIRHAACSKVAIDAAMPGGAELADRLLRADGDMRIIGLLGEQRPVGISGTNAAYASLGPWLRLATRFPTRFSAATTNPALTGLVSHCGVRVFTIPARLPAFGVAAFGGGIAGRDVAEIEVIVVAGMGAVANTAHMIMAVAHARRMGLRVGRLWLPVQDEIGLSVAKSFAAAPDFGCYEKLDEVFAGEPRRRVALQVLPDDDEMPEEAALALASGVLPILGPSGAFAGHSSLRDSLCVTYWEDAVAIAAALTRTVESFGRLVADYDRFRLDRDEMIETGLEALLAGAADRIAVVGTPCLS